MTEYAPIDAIVLRRDLLDSDGKFLARITVTYDPRDLKILDLVYIQSKALDPEDI